ncbi:matrix metalloproteinase-2-like [Homalodisca vitripennis]|uniref:matrix metalloproteinase-2-like n=1 Tax=Homalodisca vitripennis TaxID=197043 RepID=UPI001EEB5323|nr:matrix metalloproteinase-2-like [Homalodisca vitripennis]
MWRIVVVLCVSVVVVVVAAPPGRRLPYTDTTLRYLMTFGYLPASDLETGNLRTDDQLRDAIRSLQAFGNIPVTGDVDEATEKLMASPRCGVSDERAPDARRKRFAIHTGPRWDHTDLTWSLRTYHTELDHGQVRRELHQALEIWSRHSNLTFREMNSDDADIIIKFHRREHGDGYAFDGRGNILAHAFFPGEDRGGDVHFDDDETWLLEYQHKEDDDGTRLFMVAAHEFGHSLGLAHSSEPTSLMFPWYKTIDYSFDLSEDDQRGIQTLYGIKNRWAKIPTYNPGYGRPPWQPPYRPSARPTTTTTTTTTTNDHHSSSIPPASPPPHDSSTSQ